MKETNTNSMDPNSSRQPDPTPAPSTQIPFASHSIWSGFYKKALKERQSQIKLMFPHLFQESLSCQIPEVTDFPFQGLNEDNANNMIENCIGTMGLPVGLALNLTMNGKPYIVPMAIEEPSVVAAVSGASKTISTCSVEKGFHASSSERNIVYAQVQLLDIADDKADATLHKLHDNKDTIIATANQFCASMVNRGGGVVDITIRKIKRHRKRNNCSFWFVVHVHIDVCEAMGANCASTVAEGVSHYLESLTGARIGFRIVSNLCTERISKASFLIPTKKLGYKNVDGHTVAERIVESYEWACDDPFRATTHNKGIMNGIDAVAIATGQDWRAIEAASHAWASLKSSLDPNQSFMNEHQYYPLTRYWIEEKDGVEYFGGELTLPICVGTCGGVLKTNPVYSYALGLMGRPTSKELAMIMICIGLAQNFAALRAMATEGIQRGHMSLHARNICIAAGAPSHAISECVSYMIETGRISQSTVKEYLEAHELQARIWNLSSPTLLETPLSKPASMFYFEEQTSPLENQSDSKSLTGLESFVTLNIAFPTLGSAPLHIELTPQNRDSTSPIVRQLFSDKTFDWIRVAFSILDKLQYGSGSERPTRSNRILSRKLKYISVLMNLLLRGLSKLCPSETEKFLSHTLGLVSRHDGGVFDLFSEPDTDDDIVETDNSNGQEASLDHSASTPMIRTVSGLLRENMHIKVKEIVLDFQTKSVSLSASQTEPQFQALQVGLPLFLALWQVFEYRVGQWVGNPILADALILEQRRVFSSFLTTASQMRKQTQALGKSQKVIVTLHKTTKRFQATSILLCDAITLDATYVNSERLRLLRSLGTWIEWEHAICHDIAPDRLSRHIQSLASDDVSFYSNGFLLWCHEIQTLSTAELATLTRSDQKQNLKKLVHQYRGFILEKILGDISISEQDQPVLERARQTFQEYYRIE